MLAGDYINPKTRKPQFNVRGWLASEKFDGERALLIDNTFTSRNGIVIKSPEWFTELLSFSESNIDGELYFGKNTFHLTGTFRSNEIDLDAWRRVRFMIFDIPPSEEDEPENFVDRYSKLVEIHSHIVKKYESMEKTKFMPDQCPFRLVKQTEITSTNQLDRMFNEIVASGGEGLIIRKPDSRYVFGRSNMLLKYKKIEDAEAVIVGYKPGNGKFSGKLGAFIVHPIDADQKPQKKREFRVSGMNLEIRNNYKATHPIGTYITYSFRGLSNGGKPRHPSYRGIRHFHIHMEDTNETISSAPPIKVKIKPKFKTKAKIKAKLKTKSSIGKK